MDNLTGQASGTTIDDLVYALRSSRTVLSYIEDEIAATKAKIAETVLGQKLTALLNSQAAAKSAEAAAYEILTARAESQDDKHPHPAITVQTRTKLIYDHGAVYDYCVEHLPGALSLDTKKAEAAMNAGLLPDNLYTETEYKKAVVARDLSKFE